MHLKTLLLLAEKDAYVKSVSFTTPILAQQLGTSQQSASRILIKMEKEGLIERRIFGRISYVKLTDKGINELKNLYIELKSIIERPMEVTLEGRVFSGMGEGAYYLSLEWYRRQIKEKFGFDPYPGTLNVNLLSKDAIENRELVKKHADIEVNGYHNSLRSYGRVRGIPATFNDKDICAILFIERTHYGGNVIEIISPIYLRGKYGLKDGDKVKVTVSLPPASIKSLEREIKIGMEK